jgi:hypothetical protein
MREEARLGFGGPDGLFERARDGFSSALGAHHARSAKLAERGCAHWSVKACSLLLCADVEPHHVQNNHL